MSLSQRKATLLSGTGIKRTWPIIAFVVAAGSVQAWAANVDNGGALTSISPAGGGPLTAFRESPWGEQLALASALLIIKPLYTVIAALLIAVLWRQGSRDLVALRWGVILFFIGEAFCALNIILFEDSSYLLESIHGYGMVFSFGLVTYAILDGLDTRVLNYSDPQKRCAALSLCRRCVKYVDAPCGLKRIFYFLVPSLAIVAFIPLLVNANGMSYNTRILGVPYDLSHALSVQRFEVRYAPILAIILFSASFLVFLFKTSNEIQPAKALFAAGMGFFGFGFLRLIFFGVYPGNLVWPEFWEEATELMYMAGIGFTLFIFRRSLFAARSHHDAA